MCALSAKNTRFVTPYINPNSDILNLDISARVTNISKIAPAMDLPSRELVPGFNELEANILSEGMINPIVLVPNTERIYLFSTLGLSHVAPYDKSRPFLCIFGNQRLQIAVRNKYKFIDAFHCTDVNIGILIGKTLESKTGTHGLNGGTTN